jgi:DNA polymerase-3 subunit delta
MAEAGLRLPELLKRWKDGRFAPVYYFVGEEHAAKAEALARLKELFKADDFNLREFTGGDEAEAAAIVAEASTLPAFSDRRLVIAKNAKLGSSAKALLADYLKDPLKSTTLVLFSDEKKPDLKDPLTKPCEKLDGLCLFAPLSESEAQQRLLSEAKRFGKTLTMDAAIVLVGEAGTDWGILGGELEKVALFVDKSPEIGADDVLACLGYRKAANPWTLSDLIEKRDMKGALVHLQSLMKEGKADEQARQALYKIRAVIARQLKARRMQRAQVPPEQIGRAAGVYQPWKVPQFLQTLARLSETRLRRDLKRCVDCETALNSKSWLDPRVEVEQLVIGVCRS